MIIFCNTDGKIYHVIPDKVYQGSAGANTIYFVGQFPSSSQVTIAYTLPNGMSLPPKLLTPVKQLNKVDIPDGAYSVWMIDVGTRPRTENGEIEKDSNGNTVYEPDYTITENYGETTIQFYVYGGGVTLATESVMFTIEKGVPAGYTLSLQEGDDVQTILAKILNALSNTIPQAEKGAPNGVAPLDNNGRIDKSYLPTDIGTGGGSGSGGVTEDRVEEIAESKANAAKAEVLEIAQEANGNASEALAVAETAASDAAQANEGAQEAKTAANEAKTVAAAAQTAATQANTEIGAVKDTLKYYATKNELSAEVESLTNRIDKLDTGGSGEGGGFTAEQIKQFAGDVVAELNIENGTTGGSVQQKGFTYTKDGEDIVVPGAKASGEGSVAFGGMRFDKTDKAITEAKGKQSFATGGSVVVEGDWSAGFGKDTKTFQKAAFAEGGGTQAGNNEDLADNYSFAHAEGETTKAIGRGSHAEGYGGEAHGFHSHAEGVNTKTTTSGAHAEGIETVAGDTWENWVATNPDTTSIDLGAFEYPAHAEGYKSQATGYGSHAEGGNTQSKGRYAHAEGDCCEAIGYNAHAEGYYTVAKGIGSHTEGGETISAGNFSHAEGYKTQANKDNSHAEGALTQADGSYAHAEGLGTMAVGEASHAGGFNTVANYDYQTVVGKNNENKENTLFEVGNGKDTDNHSNAFEVYNDGLVVVGNRVQQILDVNPVDFSKRDDKAVELAEEMGIDLDTEIATGAHGECSASFNGNTMAYAKRSMAIGNKTSTYGQESLAGGYKSVTLGDGSLAFGDSNVTKGLNCQAMGVNTQAIGDASHATGSATIATGYASQAGGYDSQAKGYYSFAHGIGLIAGYTYQAVFGRWNNNSSDNLFEIGNGYSETSPSNAFEVRNDGTAYANGNRVLTEDEYEEWTFTVIQDGTTTTITKKVCATKLT